MDIPADDPWLVGLVNVVVLGSIATWIWIIWRWRTHGDVLQYEPRRTAPWGPAAALLGIVFALLAISAALAPAGVEEAAPRQAAEDIAARIAAFMISQLVLVGGFFVVVSIVYRATVEDLGLPRSIDEALRDVVIGIVTCFAALIPVRIVQWCLLWLMGRQEELSQHPLIETITGGGAVDNWVMFLACVSAVVVAPVCEEIAFRLLFQGSLEKWEDEQLRLQAAPDPIDVEASAESTFVPSQNDEARMTNDEPVNSPSSSFDIRHSTFSLNNPPDRGLIGLPHGWLPVLVSSLLFGLAHAGYGPEPVPLFVFAIFLGYVYQRTHRLLPCIIAHALFNLVSMLALWRIIVRTVD